MRFDSHIGSRVERSVGSVFDVDSHSMVPLDRIDNSFLVSEWERKRADPYHGDHHTAYDYGMGENRITSDSPMIMHDYYDNPTDHLTSNYDIHRTKYLSSYYVPYSTSIANVVDGENAIDEAITTALNSLKGQSSTWGADLGESKSAIEDLAKNTITGYNFINNMRKGNFRGAADALGISRRSFEHSSNRGRALANAWLSFSYGWVPLATSIYDEQKTISDIVNRNSNNVEGNGTGHASGSVDGPYFGDIRLKGEWTTSARCTLKATIANAGLFNLNKFGVTNPAAIAWELVPFSFCVDWFIPIGNTLSAITGGEGLDFHGGYFSVITRQNISLYSKTGKITDWTTVEDGGNYSEEQFVFNRTALSTLPLPKLYADMTPFSSPRAANALALVRKLT